MPRVITDDDLHASLTLISKIGSPISHSVSRRHDAEECSSPGDPLASEAVGAAADHSRSFNLEACFKMAGGIEG